MTTQFIRMPDIVGVNRVDCFINFQTKQNKHDNLTAETTTLKIVLCRVRTHLANVCSLTIIIVNVERHLTG